MSQANPSLSIWQSLSNKPAGKWLFSRVICWKAPYFGTIRPRFVELRPGYCEVRIRKRRAVQNHIGTVHAIAVCNMAELAAGTMTEITTPVTHRWIPKRMSVEYLGKAATDLKAVAVIDPLPQFDAAMDLPVSVEVTDTNDELVFRALITMWISPRKA